MPHASKEGIRADCEAFVLTLSGSTFTSKGKGKFRHAVLQLQGAAGVGLHEFGQVLGEDLPRTGPIATDKVPHLKMEVHRALALG